MASDDLKDGTVTALCAAELRHTAGLPVYLPQASRSGDASNGATVLVGAGAVNLVTAWHLIRRGVPVRIVDAGPDPLSEPDWRAMGCTFSGYGARIFSLTEARQHHAAADDLGPSLAYRSPMDEGGWRCCPAETLDKADGAWLADHERVPGWLLRQYGDCIEAFNAESAPLWRAMHDAEPALFKSSGYCPDLIRTYLDRAGLERARKHEAALGPPPRELDGEEIRRELPALASAVENGEIFGGLRVEGFSVDIHAFGRNLVRRLAESGARFDWNTRVDAILRGDDGKVRGLRSGSTTIVARSYVLSPGAYGGQLLAETGCAGSIAAVAGGWVSIANGPPSLDRPLKIARRGFGASGPAQGANVIPVVDGDGVMRLHISSGHGFLGLRPANLSPDYIHLLGEAARDTARRYFPAQAKIAAAEGLLESSLRYCIRPWTPTGLGLFESIPSSTGGVLIVAAGHNTGGFAQSPAIAQAVLATVSGATHPMQTLYHPARYSAFVASRGAQAVAAATRRDARL